MYVSLIQFVARGIDSKYACICTCIHRKNELVRERERRRRRRRGEREGGGGGHETLWSGECVVVVITGAVLVFILLHTIEPIHYLIWSFAKIMLHWLRCIRKTCPVKNLTKRCTLFSDLVWLFFPRCYFLSLSPTIEVVRASKRVNVTFRVVVSAMGLPFVPSFANTIQSWSIWQPYDAQR